MQDFGISWGVGNILSYQSIIKGYMKRNFKKMSAKSTKILVTESI